VIGQVSLGDDVSIWPMAVVRGDVNAITVGARTSVQDGSVLHVTHDGPYTPGGRALVIGRDVTIGHKAILHACTVHDSSLIGMGSSVLDGAIIERHVIVGAGALVPPGKRLTSGGLYVGAPARRARDLAAEEIESLTYSAQHYARLKDRYLAAGR
jgi:carbonic anhydrase/acetyltransferase-like protein (isoleucine patch superfamily)